MAEKKRLKDVEVAKLLREVFKSKKKKVETPSSA